MTQPDARKPLHVLNREWQHCIKCDLADRRINEGYDIIVGEGPLGGVMVIGEGPGKEEEAAVRPFMGKPGAFLRHTLKVVGLSEVAYLTNSVICRSCQPAFNGEGQPIMRQNRRTGMEEQLIQDASPKPLQLDACRPRLHEEIYLVDPVLIITVGAPATQTLVGKKASLTSAHGELREVEIPGAARMPDITEKKQVWGRKKDGKYHYPTMQNMVRYPVLPVFHPAYVLRQILDRSPQNALSLFAADMRRAAELYGRYYYEAFGGRSPVEQEIDEDALRAFEEM